MSLTQLETALVRAVEEGRRSPFGAEVRRHANRAGRPDGTKPFPSLGDFELNAYPPLRRTLAIVNASRLAGPPMVLDEDDRTHVAWVERVLEAMASIADRFWGDIQPPIRMLVTDADDATPLPFQSTYMLPGARRLHPPPLRRTAEAAGLDDGTLRWLSPVWRSAVAAPSYREALSAQAIVQADGSLYRMLRDERDRLLTSRPRPERGDEVQSFAARSVSHFLEHNVDPASPKASVKKALRGYNRFVHAMLVAWFAGLEHHEAMPSLQPGPEAMRVDARGELLTLTVTIRKQGGPEWLQIYAPFVVDVDGPLDGLYLTTAISINGMGSASSSDLTGFRVRDLASASG